MHAAGPISPCTAARAPLPLQDGPLAHSLRWGKLSKPHHTSFILRAHTATTHEACAYLADTLYTHEAYAPNVTATTMQALSFLAMDSFGRGVGYDLPHLTLQDRGVLKW